MALGPESFVEFTHEISLDKRDLIVRFASILINSAVHELTVKRL